MSESVLHVCWGHANLASLQGIVDEALEKSQKDGYPVPHVLVYDNRSAVSRDSVSMVDGRDVWWDQAVHRQASDCEVEWLDAEAPLFKVSCREIGEPKTHPALCMSWRYLMLTQRNQYCT